MSDPIAPRVWAGLECSFLTVGRTRWDQLELTGHDRREGDIRLLQQLGAVAVRYPVLWGRDAGTGGATDWDQAERRIGELCRRGMDPIVGLLHHGYGPSGIDPLDPGWPAAFARYAREVAERIPAWAVIPINEPLTTARFGGLYGWWPPYGRDDGTFADLILAQAEAQRLAARAIRAAQPGALIIANEDVGRTVGAPSLRDRIEHDDERRWLAFDLLAGRVDPHHRFWSSLSGDRRRRRLLDGLRREPEIPDVLGIDYYVTSDRYLDPRPHVASSRASRSALVEVADIELCRVAGHEIGFDRPIQATWDRYGLPLALTEVHLAGRPGDQVAWWAEAWAAALDATRRGIPILGVTAWSVFGAYDWSSILCRPQGDYATGCFDVRGRVPRRTALGRAVAMTAAGDLPSVSPGWWRLAERVTYEPLSA
jgi:dTDP-4-dehydrorhamnose reductase